MSPTRNPLSLADRSLLAALRGWGGAGDDRFWNRFEPGWRRLLQQGWNDDAATLAPDEARARVRREHQAQAHPDRSRVHPSWWLRALKDETPAVQRAVVAHVPSALRPSLLVQLGLSEDDLTPDVPPRPEALQAALAVWTERLVGDLPDRDDPLVIRAVTRLDLRELTQLMAATGLAKWTLADGAVSAAELPSYAGALAHETRTAFAGADSRFGSLARADVAAFERATLEALGSIGLTTFARLLTDVEAYRVRWALQHLPYKVAKLLRTLTARDDQRDPDVLGWELALLDLAWKRLRAEGRLQDPTGAASC